MLTGGKIMNTFEKESMLEEVMDTILNNGLEYKALQELSIIVAERAKANHKTIREQRRSLEIIQKLNKGKNKHIDALCYPEE